MENYQTKYKVACKTGSTDYDNFDVLLHCIFYYQYLITCRISSNILIKGWVGYDDNRKIENSQEKVLAKELAIDFLNKEIKKESWYKLTSKLNAIAINPISGNIDETGIVYWFRKGTP